jgi:acid phosphatase type 7
MKLTFLMLGLVAACGMNESGNLGTTKFGDTSHPALRGSPTAELRAACGDGKRMAAGNVIKRQPYLQQVTTSSAIIGWVSTTPTGERVDVTMPDGTPVVSASATTEDVVTRSGESQMWAKISNLQPDTIYCYRVANGAPMNDRTGFRTAPTADSTKPIKILAFGDSGGGGSDQYELLKYMYQFPSELIIHTGDLAYDKGTINQFEANVFNVYAELFRNLPFFPAPGNHEYETDGAAPFRAVFALPDMGGEQWYSYDWGRIHFAVIDTEADYEKQVKWLDQDLAASKAPWKIVYLHKPPYSSGDHKSDLPTRTAFKPLFEKHGVQLVLAGHDHHYERMHPQNGVAYIVTGGGGRGTRNTDESEFTALSEEVIHFVYLIDGMGQEFDSMVVPRVRGASASRGSVKPWVVGTKVVGTR